MTRPLVRFGATLVLAATAVLATACSTTPAPEATTAPTAAATSPAPQPSESTGGEPESPAAEPTCETIISDSTIESFNEYGWESQGEPFVLAGIELEGGIQCKWGDLSTASDHVQMFGWAPVTADAATSAADQLVSEGWAREDSDQGVIITESRDSVMFPDDEGYGWSYLFGDGWVKFADTKQSLVLVEWPPA